MMKLLLVISLMTLSTLAHAKTSKVKDVNTEFNFNGLNINGRYNLPSESLIRVEDDKSIDNLISIRTHFRDRIEESLSRK